MNQEEIRRSWDREVARLARRVNLGWWLQRWLPLMLGLSVFAALLFFALRSLGVANQYYWWVGYAGAVVAAMCLAWWLARRRFESHAAARIRLEDALGLRSRLTAASSGVGEWPALPAGAVALPLTWRWQHPLSSLVLCAASLLLAVYMPVPVSQAPKPHIIEKPSAVKQVEQWVEELRKDEAVSPENLAEVEKKIEEMLRRPNEQWYEHASLEAADHLRDETGKALQELGAQLEQSQGSLSTLAELGSQLSQESKQGLTQQLQNNLNGLRSGAMQANASLADQLKNIDPQSLQGMSKEQMQKLAERLKQNADALRKALANAPQYSFKEGKGQCDKPGDGPGEGDPSRGRADAKLTVKQDETQLNTKRTENLDSMLDPERVTPGDLLALQDAKPSVDAKTYKGVQAGGSLNNAGEGGAAVEKATLVPAERAVLKRFFK